MTSDRPVVSVIMPCFNVESCVEQAVKSALVQTLDKLEVIIVDDCSTDGTIEAVKRINDPRVHILRNTANRGPAYSRNRALQVAQGEWVAVLDGDDWWESSRLEKLIGCAKASSADAVCDDLYLVRESEPISRTLLQKVKRGQQQPWKLDAQTLIEKRLSALKPVFNRQFILQHGLSYRDELTYGEDLAFLLEFLSLGASVLVYPMPLYYYRQWSSSLTSQKLRLYTSMYTTLQILAKSYNDSPAISASLLRRLRQNMDQLLVHTWLKQMRTQGIAVAATELLRRPRIFLLILRRLPGSLVQKLRWQAIRLLRRPLL